MNKKLLQESTEKAIELLEENIKLEHIYNIVNTKFYDFLLEINNLALEASEKGRYDITIPCEKYFPLAKTSNKFVEFLGETVEHFTDYTLTGITINNDMWSLRFSWK